MIRFVIAQHDQELNDGDIVLFAQKGDYIISDGKQYSILNPEEFNKLFVIAHINHDMIGTAKYLKDFAHEQV